MSSVIDGAVERLAAKLPNGFDGTARFDIEGEGSIFVDENGVRAGNDDADVVLSADEDTFRDMLSGNLNPTTAFMGGRLRIDGNMGLAMKLGAALS
ncbi:MAG: SCP2 sterol-binding domain-containing protein [Rhodobacteraceae bacterium]|nr:SCP2 sterol-binding domain-containing protein [Paracoccaceae bacterium]